MEEDIVRSILDCQVQQPCWKVEGSCIEEKKIIMEDLMDHESGVLEEKKVQDSDNNNNKNINNNNNGKVVTVVEFSEDEEKLVARMFNLVGERWDLIAGRIPGRTAEEVEKYWTSRCSSSSSEKL